MEPAEPCRTRAGTEAYVYLLLMVLIGSTTATAAKFAVRELPVGLVPIIRYGGAALLLLPLVWRRAALQTMLREDFGRLFVCAALSVPINQTLFLYASQLAPTTHVGLYYASVPLVVLALAVAVGQERLVASRALGISLSVTGALVIGLENFWHSGRAGADALRGDLLLVGAVLSWGAFLAASKPLIARHGAMVALFGTFAAGALLDLPIAALTFHSWRPLIEAASPTSWWSMAHLTVVVSIVGLGCQNLAMRRLDASQVATFGNAAPLLTVFWGVWLLHEPFRFGLAVGGALIVAGIALSTRAARSAPRIQRFRLQRQEPDGGAPFPCAPPLPPRPSSGHDAPAHDRACPDGGAPFSHPSHSAPHSSSGRDARAHEPAALGKAGSNSL
jgi:drug/metabolite transporter (DMT)-like permease